METIDAFIKFLNSYPPWAKLFAVGALFTLLGILIFAPRNAVTTMRSAASQMAINVMFENATGDYVNLDWLDFNGNKSEKDQQTIEPGTSVTVSTYVGHA